MTSEEQKSKAADEAELLRQAEEALLPQSFDKYTPLKGFPTSLDLLAFADDQIQNGKRLPHKWQVETADFICQDGVYSNGSPLRFILCACNGSGKDAFTIAPFAVWHAITKVRSRCIITSSSGNQLKTQTESYIRSFASRLNDLLLEITPGIKKPFIIKQRHIVCTWTGSEILMFATDEPGRAEGYHPFPDAPEGELVVVVNEGKSIELEIYEATRRCTYNRYIIVSSPGQTAGFMYEKYKVSNSFPAKYVPGKWYSRRISYLDCPHIPANRVMEDMEECGGENTIWFRSRYKAEFTNLDQSVVMTEEAVDECIRADVPFIDIKRGRRGGLDLAAGGDENTFYVFNENEYMGKEVFRCDLPEVTVGRLILMFEKHGFNQSEAYRITGDHGGMGQVYAGFFRDRGWELSWCTNQHKANNNTLYGNKATENWFNFGKLIQRRLIRGLPKNDEKLKRQLGNRYVRKHATTDKMIVQPKAEAKAEGHPSPDRADAVVLAFVGVVPSDFKGYEVKKPDIKRQASMTSSRVLINQHGNDRLKDISPERQAFIEELYDNAQLMRDRQVSKQPNQRRGVINAYRAVTSQY